jgi:gluconolactonase
MGVPAVALLLSLLLALLGCSGDGGNERRDSGGPETVADVPTDVALDPGLDPGTDPGPVEAGADAPDLPDVPDPAPDAEVAPEASDAAEPSDAPAPSDGEGAEPPDVPAEAETTPEIVDGAGETETTLPFNCQHLPLGPLDLEKVEGAIAAEDLAFDGEGYLIGSDMSAVYKSAPGKATKIFVPNLQTRAGMRMTPAGFLAVNDDTQGRLLLYGPDGTLDRVLMQGLAYPNGMVVDLDGYVLITEHNSGRVLRVHPYTGESTVLAEGLEYPNGIVFDATYTRLYVGTFGGAKIWTFTLSRDGRPGRVEVFADLSDTPGQLDGMGVDACGNVYVCEYGSTDIWRIAPDGKTKVRIIDSDPDVTYLPNLQWGRGEGWDPRSIYVPDGWNVGVWRVQVGVPSAPLPFP